MELDNICSRRSSMPIKRRFFPLTNVLYTHARAHAHIHSERSIYRLDERACVLCMRARCSPKCLTILLMGLFNTTRLFSKYYDRRQCRHCHHRRRHDDDHRQCTLSVCVCLCLSLNFARSLPRCMKSSWPIINCIRTLLHYSNAFDSMI